MVRKLKRVQTALAQLFRGDTGADARETELRAQQAQHEADLEYIDVSQTIVLCLPAVSCCLPRWVWLLFAR